MQMQMQLVLSKVLQTQYVDGVCRCKNIFLHLRTPIYISHLHAGKSPKKRRGLSRRTWAGKIQYADSTNPAKSNMRIAKRASGEAGLHAAHRPVARRKKVRPWTGRRGLRPRRRCDGYGRREHPLQRLIHIRGSGRPRGARGAERFPTLPDTPRHCPRFRGVLIQSVDGGHAPEINMWVGVKARSG